MADSDFITSPNTGASLEALSPDDLRKLWAKKVAVCEQETDFYQQLEGTRADSLIETRTETAVGAGQSIRFTSMAGFYQEGVHGDGNFAEPSDYEAIRIASNDLKVDWVRHGVRYNERMEEHMGLRYEIVNKVPDEQGKWMGRKKCRSTEIKFVRLARSNSYNFICAGGGTDIDALGGSNGLGWQDIVDSKTIMQSHGAAPAMVAKIGRNAVHRYAVIASHIALGTLKKDDNYDNALKEAGNDSNLNPLFTGGYADIDGNFILERQIIDHDGDGPLGAPIAPKLRIAEAITAGTAAFTVTGGTNPKVLYTSDFPNHAFKHNASDIESAGTDPFYLLIVNPPNAETDPGKMGFYKCVTNNGKTISVTERLGENGGGARHPVVGSVTWNTGKWAGKHTDVHPAGAMAYLANAKGQPIGYTVLAGSCAMRRGYGKYRNARSTDSKEGGFVNESYITSVFGSNPKANVRGEFPNFLVIAHSLHYPGTPIPQDLT